MKANIECSQNATLFYAVQTGGHGLKKVII